MLHEKNQLLSLICLGFYCLNVPLSFSQHNPPNLRSLHELEVGDYVVLNESTEQNKWDCSKPPELSLWWESRYTIKEKRVVTGKNGAIDTTFF